jgi:hypothetical protein
VRQSPHASGDTFGQHLSEFTSKFKEIATTIVVGILTCGIYDLLKEFSVLVGHKIP